MTTPPEEVLRVAIVGSREYAHPEKVREFVRELAKTHDKKVVIVSGGANGVDSVAADEAVSQGLHIAVWRPNWSQGKRAALKRNYQIVNDASKVVAFWDEESRGTAHSMKIAINKDKLWKVFGVDGSEMDHDDLNL